jgi:protein-L-isoaspartate(D-aspartate) O-methyltransferase
VLVPRFYDWEGGTRPPDEPVVAADDPRRWLPKVYSDVVLAIEVDRHDGTITSSSSRPSMMAVFLETLDVRDRGSVLEIGTGSGYNAALLCERLGSDLVTTVDVAPELIEAARPRLDACGYSPTVAVADGRAGYPERAPYDRIVATCSVERIPSDWYRQLRPGGVVVAPLSGGRFTAGLVSLRMQSDGSLAGRLRRELSMFMPMVGGTRPPPPEPGRLLAGAGDGTRCCTVPPWFTLGDDTFNAGLFFRQHAPDAVLLWRRPGEEWNGYVGEDRDGVAVIGWRDQSWARVAIPARGGLPVVTQSGPRCLWDIVEDCWGRYVRAGRPGPERYGWTVRPDGSQFLWLDSPDSGHAWEL